MTEFERQCVHVLVEMGFDEAVEGITYKYKHLLVFLLYDHARVYTEVKKYKVACSVDELFCLIAPELI